MSTTPGFHWHRPEVLKCDFCSTTEGLMWMETTDRFTLAPFEGQPAYVDDGGWIACDTCHSHVEAGDKQYLRSRVADCIRARLREGEPVDVGWTTQWNRRLLHAFFRHRTGSVPFG